MRPRISENNSSNCTKELKIHISRKLNQSLGLEILRKFRQYVLYLLTSKLGALEQQILILKALTRNVFKKFKILVETKLANRFLPQLTNLHFTVLLIQMQDPGQNLSFIGLPFFN
jgi:hypothetical protein